MSYAPIKMTECRGCHKCRYGFTGAGVLLVDLIRGQIILVRVNGEYTDPGGCIGQQNDTLSYTASRELYEETAGSVSTTQQCIASCKYVDIPAGKYHKYRCFIMYASTVSCSTFYNERKKLQNAVNRGMYISHCFFEADRMTRFSIAQFKRSINKTATTDNGEIVVLSNRIMKIIKAAVKSRTI